MTERSRENKKETYHLSVEWCQEHYCERSMSMCSDVDPVE